MKYLITTLLVSTQICLLSQKKVSYTVYNALPGQTDSSPNVTADQSKIIESKVISGKQRWIAISQEMRKTYKYGDTVVVSGSSQPKFNGEWVVHDCMNKRFKSKIDFLVPKTVKLGKGTCIITKK